MRRNAGTIIVADLSNESEHYRVIASDDDDNDDGDVAAAG